MLPRVSIIVPCWGVEKYLDQCLESLVNQTLRDIEIILVDDESPDNVPEMCDKWAQKDSRIKVVHKQNAGLGMACNSGLEIATGQYVAFCDADDWVDLNMYQVMYDTAIKHQAQMVMTGLRRVDMRGVEKGYLPHKKDFGVYNGSSEIESLAADMIASAADVPVERTLQMSAKVILYDRELLKKHSLYFVSERDVMSEDLHFNLNVFKHAHCVCVLPQSFYNYRCTDGSITQKLDKQKFNKIKLLYNYTIAECKNLEYSSQINERVMRMFIGYVRDYIRSVARSSLSAVEQQQIIQDILNDNIWDSVWKNYPLSSMAFKYRLPMLLMKNKCSFGLKLLLKYK